MQVGGAELGEVVQPLGQLRERAAEPVDVADVALHAGSLEPAGVDLPPPVQPPQGLRPLRRSRQRHAQPALEQLVDDGRIAAPVEQGERAVHVVQGDLDAGEERVRLGRTERGLGVGRQSRAQRLPRACRTCDGTGQRGPPTIIGPVSGQRPRPAEPVFAQGVIAPDRASDGVHCAV